MAQRPRHTREEVETAAKAAGLTHSRGPIQLLHFSHQLNSEDVKLMEVPHEVLRAVQDGQRVVIRGDPSEDAVLCTEDRTYELRGADTSNTLLVTPTLTLAQDQDFQEYDDGCLISREVTACVSSYFDLRQCRPRTERLKHLLAECPYRGPEYEGGGGGESEGMEIGEEGVAEQPKRKNLPKKYTFDELLDHVQASEQELWDSLDQLQACLINGCWQVLDPDYRDQVFQHILTLLEEEDWSYRHIPLESTCQKLEELEPRFAIEHCLRCYGRQLENSSDTDPGEVYYELLEERVCQFYAELLLRPAGKFNYHEFMEAWQQSVPEGMTTDLSQLAGLALTDMGGIPPVIWHFPASELPEDPTTRFDKLFSVREKWTHEEIEPYIRNLETSTQSLNALLLKYARMSTNTRGQKVYNARRTAMAS